MKKINTLIALLFMLIINASAQTRDSIFTRIITKPVTHDSTFQVTIQVAHDSSFTVTDTVKVPVLTPTLKGIYGHPDQVNIGNQQSENAFLSWAKREGANMINMYARSYLYTDASRTQLASFVSKARTQYGIVEFSVDVRLTNSGELPGWKAYLAKYANTTSKINALTEFEPYVRNAAGQYDYPGFFNLVRTMGKLCDQYNVSLDFYEGWIGNNYSNPQQAVDSMVFYCDRIFISNYVTVSDYNSTSTSLGAWDNRMDKRTNAIAISCKKFGKVNYPIIEIVSLEPVFLFTIYDCTGSSPASKCNSFFGATYDKAVIEFRKSLPDVLSTQKLVGRTIFYSKYAKQAHP